MSSSPAFQHATVLIVDDDPDIALALHDLLAHAGYRVETAASGAAALTVAKTTPVDVVLLDLMLPDMDGLSVLTLLQGVDSALPVIMLTAFVEVAKKHGSLTEGAFGYLTKPYDREEVKALVRRAVTVKRLSSEAVAARQALSASEQQFREVVETASDAIILADVNGRVRSWNAAAEQLFGYTAAEAVGQCLTRLMPERYHSRHRLALQRVEQTGEQHLKGQTIEVHGLHKKGHEFPVEMSLSSWISGGQRFHCGILRDITARKLAEKQLARQQMEQQALLDLIPAMVWYKDADNRILRVNRRAAGSIGKTVADVEGRSTYELYPEEANKYHRDDLEVIASGRPKTGIMELYQTGSGEKRWVQTDKVPYRDASGTIVGVLVFAQDLTERKQTEEALRLSEEQVRAIVESVPTGIALLSADGRMQLVNGPLAAMLRYGREELVGRPIEDLVVEGFRARCRDLLRAAAASLGSQGGIARLVDVPGLRKDGTEAAVTLTVIPFQSNGAVQLMATFV